MIIPTRPFHTLLLILLLALIGGIPLRAHPTPMQALGSEPDAPVICIDPGHPSEVNNGLTVQNGTTETHIDWVVAQKLQQLLTQQGYKVVLTKAAETQLVKNKERALIANRAHAALMVRLHCDSSTDKGYALYYPDRQGTAQGKTGPTADIMKRSKRAAETLDAGMAKVLEGHLKNGGVRGDSKTAVGSKQGALTGSIFSEVPVVTIEMVVLNNKGDAAYIKTEDGQQQMAQAIADGITRFVPLKKQSTD
ncbi:MAG TPA: N-acetylmuramoyl-L-alanine amidase [Chthonomonadaceae bacterium]|nr:N-acetylmuramoyl-L-alanine amidase [Chthonomonadaceae bacterium]